MSTNRPPYGEQAPTPVAARPPAPQPTAKKVVKFGPAHYVWRVVLAAVITPGIIALWKLVL